MEKDKLRSRLAALLQKQKERKRWLKAVSALGCVIVFCTVYTLVLPAITMEKEPRVLKCPLEIHTHSEACYDGEQNLICGKADYVLHTHQEDCYDSEGSLVCTLPEKEAHTHTDECWEEQTVLICGREEGTGHVHGESCYETAPEERTLVCGREESAGHVHGESCYETVTEEKTNLICGQDESEEHAHDESCYETVTEEKTNLICGREEGAGAHAHDESCYQTTAGEQTLVCGREEGAGAHTHDESCYQTEKVLVCEKEEITAHTHGESCRDGAGNLVCGLLEVQEHVHGDGCFAPVENKALAAEADPFPEAIELQVGETLAAEITEGNKEAVFRFVPEHTHNYRFLTTSDMPAGTIVLTLYDAEGGVIQKSDSGAVAQNLTAGETYYWSACFTSSDNLGQIPLLLEYIDHSFKKGNDCDYCQLKFYDLSGYCGDQRQGLYDHYKDIRWEITEQGELQVTGSGWMGDGSQTNYAPWSCAKDYIIRAVIGEGIENIFVEAFKGSNLVEIQLPSTLNTIGKDAFIYSELVEAVIPQGITKIPSGMFTGCNNLKRVVLKGAEDIDDSAFEDLPCLEEITFPKSLTRIGYSAFQGVKSLKHVIWEAESCTIDPDAFRTVDFSGRVDVAASADELPENFFMIFGKGSLAFSGPNMFRAEAGWTMGKTVLDKGDYYADEQGALYRLYDAPAPSAEFAYCPPGLTDYTIPKSLTVEEKSGTEYPVKKVGACSIANADKLLGLTLEAPGQIESIEEYAFALCPTLKQINGKTEISEVKALFQNNAFKGNLIFYNTGLGGGENTGGESLTEPGSSLTVKGKEGLELTIFDNGNTHELLTGQSAEFNITVSNEQQSAKEKIRVYIQFTDLKGKISPDVGTYTYQTDTGKSEIEVRVSETAVKDIYCVEIADMTEGDTLNFKVSASYPSPESAGGSAFVWGTVLTKDEAEDLDSEASSEGNPQTGVRFPNDGKRLKFSWSTVPDGSSLTTTGSDKVALRGNGETIYVGILGFDINHKWEVKSENYGRDPIIEATFTDEIEIPEEFIWNPEAKEAVEKGTYRFVSGGINDTEDRIEYYSESKGEYKTLFKFLWDKKNTHARDVSLQMVGEDENKRLQLVWTYDKNEPMDFMLSMQEDAVHLKDLKSVEDALASEEKVRYEFKNKVTVRETFLHSPEQQKTAEASSYAQVEESDYTIEINSPLDSIIYSENFLGEECINRVTVENTGVLPYRKLNWLNLSLSDEFYVKPEGLQSMLEDQTLLNDVPRGKRLHVWLKNATLCTPVKETVSDISGEQKTVSQANRGTNTGYEIPSDPLAVYEDVCSKTEQVDMEIKWQDGDEGKLILTVIRPESAEKEILIGEGEEYATISEALAAEGFVVTADLTYNFYWDLTQFTLYGLQEYSISVPSFLKDTFMQLKTDKLECLTLDRIVGRAHASGEAGKEYKGKGVYEKADGYVNKSDSAGGNIFRDFVLRLRGEKNGQPGELDMDSSIREGDIIRYKAEAVQEGKGSYEALPMVSFCGGGQVLLAPAEENPDLADQGLPEVEAEGILYYKLTKAGTYRNVRTEGRTADSVEVQENGDALLRWYVNDQQKTFEYLALVEADTSDDASLYFSLDNCLWLNDHQSHRLFAPYGLRGNRIEINKNIVIEGGTEPGSEKLDKYSAVSEGQEVTYRLDLYNLGMDALTIKGEYLWDVLPFSLDNYWTKENVKVRYGGFPGSKYTISGDEKDGGWEIVDQTPEGMPEAENQQYLRWNHDFEVNFTGTFCIYVTVTFPKDTENSSFWSQYVEKYSSGFVQNTFYAYNLWSRVRHTLSIESGVYLQKGVLETGQRGLSAHEDNRHYYVNEANNENGYVIYYVSLYNGGSTRLYLTEIQDVLPKGFTLNTFTGVETGADIAEIRVNHQPIQQEQYKAVSVSYTQSKNQEGHQVITFTFSEDEEKENTILYDKEEGMYYLAPGEGFAFSYRCATNRYEDTEDAALNRVSMPYYDYNRGGAALAEGVSSTGKPDERIKRNEGTCYILDRDGAKGMGFLTDENTAVQWLTSDVTVRRGKIAPDISKKVTKAQNRVTQVVVENPEIATSEDILTWEVTAHNSGNAAIRNYTLTDVMESPYRFTGKVGCRVKPEENDSWIIEGTLFEFVDWIDKDTVKIKADQVNTRYETLDVRKPEWVEAKGYLKYYRTEGYPIPEYLNADLKVWLGRDDKGNLTLSVQIPGDIMAIMPGGRAILTLETEDITNEKRNTIFLNTSYITPTQPFDRGQVARGRYTEYALPGEETPQPSVVNNAQILLTYGYATSSLKAVEELKADENGELSPTGNAINSRTDPYYITMSDQEQKQVRYTLTVNNGVEDTNLDLDQLTVIDSLPRTGDHSVFDKEDLRYSEFAVHLEDDPDFKVVVKKSDNTSVTLNPDQYRLEYSEGRDFTEEDWAGEEKDDDQWSDTQAADAQSFRLVIEKDADGKALVPAGATVEISFNARLSDEAKEGQLAWNSFGYSYVVPQGAASITLKAAPLKVGVKVPFVPRLVKELKTESGTPFRAEEEMTFDFLIYTGEAVEGLESLSTEAEIEAKLDEERRTYGKVTLTVPEGASASEEKVLDAEALPGWKWENGASYTLLELPFTEEGYEFGYIGELQSPNNYTFRYQGAALQRLAAVNVRDTWEILIFKRDGATHTSLTGAVFGLYAGDSTKQMTADGYAAKLEELGLDPSGMPSYEKINSMQTAQGGSTAEDWYLTEIGVSGTDGELSFSALSGAAYYVRELKAPGGYSLSKEQGKVVRREDCADGQNVYYWTVYNESAYELPKTGGTGTGRVRTLGVLTAAAAALLLAYVGKRRKTKCKK